MAVRAYSKTQRERIRADADRDRATAALTIARVMWAALAVLPLTAIMVYVHIYAGYQTVLWILAISAILMIAFLSAYMNDRGQERAGRHSVEMAAMLGKGINEAVAQNARTQGDAERAQLRIWVNEQMQSQRVDAARQIVEQRNQATLPIFDDDDSIDDAQYERYEEVY